VNVSIITNKYLFLLPVFSRGPSWSMCIVSNGIGVLGIECNSPSFPPYTGEYVIHLKQFEIKLLTFSLELGNQNVLKMTSLVFYTPK